MSHDRLGPVVTAAPCATKTVARFCVGDRVRVAAAFAPAGYITGTVVRVEVSYILEYPDPQDGEVETMIVYENAARPETATERR